MSGNRRHWGGKFTEKHAYRFRLSRHPAWISENDLLMYRCNMSTLQALLGRTGDSSDRCGLVDGCIPSRGGSHGLKMERFTLHRSTLLHARMAIAVSAGISGDGSVRSGGQGRKPIGRRPQLTRQEMRPMRGCRIRGIRSYTTTSAAITSLRWNCSALQCTRYHTSRICARCFGATVWQANTRRLAVVLS